MRTRDTTRKFFICTKLGHLAENYMNTTRIEDEKKAKADNKKKQMRQQWIPKSSKNETLSHEVIVKQELGDSSIST